MLTVLTLTSRSAPIWRRQPQVHQRIGSNKKKGGSKKDKVGMDKAVNKEIMDLHTSPKMATVNANMVVVSPT
uniref:Uncharacterized protein n=1 Tax=Timema cristinae TaxID=61476 RepID=A0A7R9GRF3_TIMCR|nr:unnamed protein product [Timema cristinae]